MVELNTIQKRGKLNDIYAVDEKGAGNAHHRYIICRHGETKWANGNNDIGIVAEIQFQHGPRFEIDSQEGVSTNDLLEICRNQLACFQTGEYANRETAIALTHIEEAILWLTKRAEERLERGVLGTHKK